MIVAISASYGIPLVDLTADFNEANARGEELYFATDGHWNPEGHRVAAEAIFESLIFKDWRSGLATSRSVSRQLPP
jgi:lysophospholipase L1-like esterase